MKTFIASIVVLVVLIALFLHSLPNGAEWDDEIYRCKAEINLYVALYAMLVTAVLAVAGIEMYEIKQKLRKCLGRVEKYRAQ